MQPPSVPQCVALGTERALQMAHADATSDSLEGSVRDQAAALLKFPKALGAPSATPHAALGTVAARMRLVGCAHVTWAMDRRCPSSLWI